jgi:hypothetical protein
MEQAENRFLPVKSFLCQPRIFFTIYLSGKQAFNLLPFPTVAQNPPSVNPKQQSVNRKRQSVLKTVILMTNLIGEEPY